MANRRRLKKEINNICSDLMLAIVLQDKPQSTEKLESIVEEILALNVEFVKRISHTEPGSVRLFYAKLRQEFSEKVQSIYAKLSEA